MAEADESNPDAEGMHLHAATLVARLTGRSRLPLDYSVASLRLVDFLIDGMRKGGASRERVRGPLLGLGAYVGEVLVRHAGATWVDFDADLRSYFGQPVGVRMQDGRLWNPLGKVLNRFETGGARDSLQIFYLTLHGRPRRATVADAQAGGVRAEDVRRVGGVR
ncbi:hypothetical protein ACFY0A_01515 [Streptomyces sp. NPDC001698]|uniref:hypothetical protein n=1 Tax=unclassified Streptomyces TaxID=2593676 RepID=UPI00367EC842